MVKLFKKIVIVFILFTFILSSFPPVFAYSQIPQFLCELGLKYYQQGNFDLALHEFKKALIVDPNYEPALKYIQVIEMEAAAKEMAITPAALPSLQAIPSRKKTRQEIVAETLELYERKLAEVVPAVAPPVILPEKYVTALMLDEKILATQPQTSLEIEIGKSLVIRGQDISRFLAALPDILDIERKSADEIVITAKNFGSTYLHIWDSRLRWTLNVGVVPEKPAAPAPEEIYRKELEEAQNFKLRYSFDWSNFEMGRRVNTLERQALYFTQWLGLTGQTPYGMFDSSVQLSRLRRQTNLTYLTLGLTDGHIGKLRDFDLRSFDYNARFSGLSFPGEGLRGVRWDSPAFNNKIYYTLLWGREGQGRYGGLSPGLAKMRDAYLYGGQLAWLPNKFITYKFNAFQGYGDQRLIDVTNDVFGLEADYNFKHFGFGYELGYDNANLAYLINSRFNIPKFRLTTEFRDIHKDYLTIVGRPGRSGEYGGLFTIDYVPTPNIFLSNRLDIYRDRLFPNPSDPSRYNLTYNPQVSIALDPTVYLRLGYENNDERGKLSPRQFQRYEAGITKTFDFIKRLNTYVNYAHQKSKNLTSPGLDYTADQLVLGLRFNLISELYYYVSKQISWVEEAIGERGRPHALETGLDFSRQIYKSPFYGTWRLRYRDEEDATTAHSFLAGEDSLETQGEITFRPTKGNYEAYLNGRLRNVWAENSDVSKRVELDIRTGMRLVFNTGLKWNAVGNIQVVAFKDFNQDGLKQDNEPLMEGIKLFLDKKSVVTDKNGIAEFKNIRGRKAYINIDPASIPPGFVLTTPGIQETAIIHHTTTKLWFGIVSRSEVYGIVFEDLNSNGKFDPDERGLSKVILVLEDGTKTTTNESGQYYIRKITPGEHTLTIDINSIPLDYLPQVPITKKFTLFEGATFTFDVPLKRAK